MVLLKIGVNDKGNPALRQLNVNAKKVNKTAKNTGITLKKVFGAIGLYRGVTMLTSQLSNLTNEVFKYDKALRKFQGISGATQSEMASMNKVFRSLASDTEHLASTTADAGLTIRRMGATVNEVIQILPQALDLATVASVDANWAAENTMNTLRAFGLEASEAGRVTRVLATTVKESGVGFENFMETMKYVAPIAKTAGVSLEETAAMMGVMGNMAIKGSLAGTTMKNMFLNLLKPGDKVAGVLKDIDFEGKNFAEVLAQIKTQLGKDAVVGLLETFQKRAIAGTLAIAENTDAVADLHEKLTDADTSMKEMAETIRSAFIPKLLIIRSVVADILISVWENFGDHASGAVDKITNKLKSFRDWVENNGHLIEATFLTIGDTLKIIYKNLNTIIRILVARSMLNGIHNMGLMKDAFVSTAVKSKMAEGAVRGLSLTMNKANLIVLALTGVIWGLNKAFDAYEKHLDKKTAQSAAVTDSKTRLKDLKEYKKMLDDLKPSGEMDLATFKKNRTEISDKYILLKKRETELISKYGETFKVLKGNDKALAEHIENLETLKEMKAGAWSESPETPSAEKNGLPEDPKNPYKELLKNSGGGKSGAGGGKEDSLWDDLLTKSIKYHEKNIKEIEDQIKKYKKELKTLNEEEQERINQITDIYKRAGEQTKENLYDIFSTSVDLRIQKLQEAVDKENEILDSQHAIDLERAGDNAFKRALIEEEYQKKRQDIAEQAHKKDKELKRRQQIIDEIKARSDAAFAIIQLWAGPPKGIAGAIAKGVMSGVVGTATEIQLAQMRKARFRYGTGIEGAGNGTSDSVPAMLSKGEVVLSNPTLERVGRQNLQQFIDRGTTNSSTNVYVENFFGTQEFASMLIPKIKKELRR